MKLPLITVDPEIHSGTPVFRGTRVPVKTLFDRLEAGDSLDVFLEDFPSVSRELAITVLKQARAALLSGAHRTNVAAELRTAVDACLSGVTPQELALLDSASRNAEKTIEDMNAMLGATNRRADEVFKELEQIRGSTRTGL
jgi:uncharacterized protein (DUF433 family)